MRPLPVFRRALADSWRGLIGWAAGVAATLALYLPLYPDIGGNGQLDKILESLPPELIKTLGYAEIGSGAGYTQATFYGLIGYLLMSIAGITWGSAAVAGAEESGRLELELAHAVGRVRYALESALAILVRLLVLGVVAGLIVWALNGPARLGLDPPGIVAESLAILGLTTLSVMLALAVGAVTGRRTAATAAGAGIAVYGFVVNAIANQSADLDAWHAASPYHWAYGATPLSNGFDWGGLALLWGLSAVFVIGGVLALRRRDVIG